MINERMCLFWRRIRQETGHCCDARGSRSSCPLRDFAMSGMTAFLIAAGGVSVICYWLMTRVQNRAARRDTTSTSNDYSYDSGGSSCGGWNIASWFSSDNSSSDSSSSSGASGGGDSGGSDGGGGGGDGSGGGGGD